MSMIMLGLCFGFLGGILLRMPSSFLSVFVFLPIFVGLVLVEPIRMMLFYPVAMIHSPPIAIVPFVMLVPVAIVVAPIRMVLGPFGMMTPEPVAIVLMPPG